MGIPAFVAASAKAAAAQDVTPALPAGMTSGDAIVVLVAACPVANTITITDGGSIGNWNTVSGSPITVTGGMALYVWWGPFTGGSTGPTLHASASDIIIAATAAWSECPLAGNVVDIAATGSETTSDTSFSFATGISSTRNNCLAICAASILRDSNTGSVPVMANASLGSLASRLNICTNTGSGGGFGVSEGTKASAGTLGTWSCTYSTASAKSYLTLALIGGKSAVVSATNLSVSDTVSGSVSKSGAAALSLSVSDTVSGTRTTLGVVSATNLTVSQVVSGSVSKTGAAALDLSVSDTVSGFKSTTGAVVTNLVVSDVVAGFKSTTGVVTPTDLVVTDTVVGVRTVLGTITATNLTVAASVTGLRTTFGASSTSLVVSDVVLGVRSTFGTITPTNLIVTDTVVGVRTILGTVTQTTLTVSDVVVGFKSTTGTVTPTGLVVTDTVVGVRTVLGVATPTSLVVTQFVDGSVTTGGGNQVFGIVSPTSLVVSSTVAGVVTKLGTIVQDLVVAQNVVGQRGTFGNPALDLLVTQNVVGTLNAFGSASLNLVVTQSVRWKAEPVPGRTVTFPSAVRSLALTSASNRLLSIPGSVREITLLPDERVATLEE